MSELQLRSASIMALLSGVLLLFVALGFGFSGYLLPWNELSYYATLVGTQIPGTVPVVGQWIVHFLRGGPEWQAR